MSNRKKQKPPRPPLPAYGGGYVRAGDGSLDLVEHTASRDGVKHPATPAGNPGLKPAPKET